MDPSPKAFSREEWFKFAYNPNPPDLSEDTRKVLEQYSKIPPEEVIGHVEQIVSSLSLCLNVKRDECREKKGTEKQRSEAK